MLELEYPEPGSLVARYKLALNSHLASLPEFTSHFDMDEAHRYAINLIADFYKEDETDIEYDIVQSIYGSKIGVDESVFNTYAYHEPVVDEQPIEGTFEITTLENKVPKARENLNRALGFAHQNKQNSVQQGMTGGRVYGSPKAWAIAALLALTGLVSSLH